MHETLSAGIGGAKLIQIREGKPPNSLKCDTQRQAELMLALSNAT